MKIDITDKGPYEAVIDAVREIARTVNGGIFADKIVRIRTTVLGESNELMLADIDTGGYLWENDWYEGGDVELLGFIDLDDLIVPPLPAEDKK